MFGFLTKRRIFMLIGIAFLLGCESSTEPTISKQASDIPDVKVPIRWSCYDPTDPHCINTPPPGDLCPECSGVFLGADYSTDDCTATSINDSDSDGFDDSCEYQLALAFRPLLATNPYDQVLGREPYWAVKVENGTVVKIMYMFAYYEDGGNSFDCPGLAQFGLSCEPHLGDNEFVVAHVLYDGGTKHWILDEMFMSAHYGCTHWLIDCDSSGSYYRNGDYPQAPI
ncbi:MAG: hypothetical protein ACT443_11245 [Gemmatimonadota bacterium]